MIRLIRLVLVMSLLASTCFGAGEKEQIKVLAARMKYGLSLKPVMPDAPPNIRLNNVPKSAPQAASEGTSLSEQATVPIASGWHLNGGHATVEHVIAHGCPAWVAQKYSSNALMLDQIHSGYHEMARGGSYKMMTVKKDAATTLSQPAKMQATSPCPGGVCPINRPRRRGLFN